MWQYRFTVTEKAVPAADANSAKTYGICVEESTAKGWVPLLTVPDISRNQTFLRQLADRCNRLQLSPVHTMDVVWDAIS